MTVGYVAGSGGEKIAEAAGKVIGTTTRQAIVIGTGVVADTAAANATQNKLEPDSRSRAVCKTKSNGEPGC